MLPLSRRETSEFGARNCGRREAPRLCAEPLSSAWAAQSARFPGIGPHRGRCRRASGRLAGIRESRLCYPRRVDGFGTRYTIDFEMVRSTKQARIRGCWIVLIGDGLPRLTSCYVL